MQKQNETTLKNDKFRMKLCSLLVLLVLICLLAISIGRYSIPIMDIIRVIVGIDSDQQIWNVLFLVRIPRIVAALLIGSALALSGTVYQSMFRNPLVSQDILGVSSGATVGASIAILLGFSTIPIIFSAFITGLVAVALTILISIFFKSRAIITLVLAGIVVSGIFSSMAGLIKYLADTETQLAPITFWTLGSLAAVTIDELFLVSLPIILSIICIFMLRWKLNLFLIDDSNSSSDNKVSKYLLIVFSTILTASAVSIAGTIGWVGLVIPHIGRAIIGSENKKLMPVSTLLGGIFMVGVDTIARNASSVEIPLSILTGTVGAPLFIWIVYKNRRRLFK